MKILLKKIWYNVLILIYASGFEGCDIFKPMTKEEAENKFYDSDISHCFYNKWCKIQILQHKLNMLKKETND